MKKYLCVLITTMILLVCVSCENTPSAPTEPKPLLTIYNNTHKTDVFWQMIKDGEEESDIYEQLPVGDYFHVRPEQGAGYSLRFYRVSRTVLKQEDGKLVESRLIERIAEVHVDIDHYRTAVYLTWTNDGINVAVEQKGEIG